MTSQDPVTSKSHTFQDHHGDVRSRLRVRRDRELRGRTVPVSWLFFGLFPGLSRSYCFFLSFFFWDWEVSVSFSCLTSLFVCARARAFLFRSGWLLDFPAPRFPSSQYVIPLENYTSMTSVDCRVISSSHVYSLTKWKCDSDAVMSEYKRPTVASLLSTEVAPLLEGSKPTAHRSRRVGGREAGIFAHEWKQQEAPLPHCRFEKSRQASPSLWTDKAKSPCACRFASTSNDHSISDGETELETSHKATLTSRTEKITPQNIRLNSCSCTLKERSDSDDMVRQKSSKKQRKSPAGDAGNRRDADVWQNSRSRSVRPAATCVGMLRYSMTTTRKVKDLCSPRGAKKKVLLGTSSTATLLEKIHARNVGQFWNLAGILLDYRRIIQT